MILVLDQIAVVSLRNDWLLFLCFSSSKTDQLFLVFNAAALAVTGKMEIERAASNSHIECCTLFSWSTRFVLGPILIALLWSYVSSFIRQINDIPYHGPRGLLIFASCPSSPPQLRLTIFLKKMCQVIYPPRREEMEDFRREKQPS